MAATAFPNYTQIPKGVSIRTWWAIRVASITAALVVAGLLIASPDDGLFVMWKLVIPLLPLLFMVAPGVWRNLCPLAASNQTPRVLGLTRGLTAPAWLKEYGYVIAISLFVLFVVLRKLGLDDNGPASALLLLGALAGGFLGGMYLKGKSGWCSSICPLLPVQRIYGQTPFALVGNSHCQPCVGCTTNATTSTRRPPTSPTCTPTTRTGRATGASSSPPSRASSSRSSRSPRHPTRSASPRCSGAWRSTWR
jgi:nitrite reductase (NADH) large subunit